MKLELKPHVESVSERVGDLVTNAGVSKDGSIRWVYRNSYLEVNSPRTNHILASWRFGKELKKDRETRITAVKDVKTQAGLLLVVATSNESECGTLNFFSVKRGRVINVIEIPNRIRALEVIFENTTEDVSPWIISKHLQFFSGLVAVGTEGGFVYLVDLCLDDLDMSSASEAAPKKLMVITARLVNPLEKKEQARSYDKHLALLLDDQCHKQEEFYYRRQDDTVQKVFDEDTIWVSSLFYMAQAGTLAIGFSFGCFQLWRLYNPVLDYSSRYSPDNPAVSHFLSQEPENDPRNFVYLWVVFDTNEEDSLSNICLYQLSFAKKDVYASFGTFYDELESVCPRLDHNLTIDPYSAQPSGTTRSTMICCYTLQNPHYAPPSSLSESFDDGFHGNDSSLSIFVWRADGKQSGRGTVTSSYWLSIFDINRWYHAQMPHSVRCHGAYLQVCSFWAAYNLDDTVSRLTSHTLLNVEANVRKVLKFINNSPVPPEEHSYPSALALPVVRFVMTDGTIQAECKGWQRSLLRELMENAAQYLVQPADFYHQCLLARLLPQGFEDSRTRSTDYQRKMLLDMALEQCLAQALVAQCVKVWEEDSFAEHGSTLSFLLSWAWDTVVTTKTAFDKACSVLYDWSASHLDTRTTHQISSLSQALGNIRGIFHFFLTQAPPTTEKGQFELELRHKVLTVLLQHCDVVRWATSRSLLPEVGETNEPHAGLFAFPAKQLQQAYERRRAELSARKGCIEGMSLLLIDTLVESQGPYIKEAWQNLGGDGMYPPPSMQALMSMYLIEEVSLDVKNAIMLYFLQNISMLDPTLEGDTVASFIRRFLFKPSIVHQAQGFWFIDHCDFEEGFRHLVNANVLQDVCSRLGNPTAVVNTLLAQGQGHLAICYMSPNPVGVSHQEQELHISVLLENRHVSQALELLRWHDEERRSVRLFEHLLRECQARKLLGQVLRLNPTEWEERVLESYLRARPEPHALEPLLFYYLHRSRFQQAYNLNLEMNAQDKLAASLTSSERSQTRNRLMEAYLKVLPDVMRKMIVEKHTTHATATSVQRIQVERPKPLSTVVRQAEVQFMSQAKFIMAVIDKVNEANHLLHEEEEEETSLEGSLVKDGPTEASDVDFAFLKTPRTRGLTPAKRKPEVNETSQVATPELSQSVRKTLAMIRDAETEEEKESLKKLAEGCLQILQTPVRDHKQRATSPHLSAQVSDLKTPQSILKVRRLSKTLPNSRDKLRARRASGPRSVKVGVSKSDMSHNSSYELKSPVTPLTTATPSQKQLRFTGISPSPTPSPSVNLSVSIYTEEFIETEQSISSAPSEAEKSCIDTVSKVVEIADFPQEPQSASVKAQEMEVVVTEVNVAPPTEERRTATLESVQVDAHFSEGEQLSFEEGPEDRYSDQLKVLVRPDLQSPWKQGSPGLAEVDWESHNRSPGKAATSPSSPKLVGVEQDSSLMQQTFGGTQVSVLHTAEKLSESYTDEVVSSRTSILKDLKPKSSSISPNTFTKLAVSSLRPIQVETTPPATADKRLDSPPAAVSSLRPIQVETTPPATADKRLDSPPAAVSSLRPIQVETTPPATADKHLDSPPATPPSSKRAKMMMVFKGEETAGLIEIKSRSLRASSGEERETRRRKTPERRTLGLVETTEVMVDESDSVEDRVETRRTKTPERKSPARQQRATQESSRKTPERKSPARQQKATRESSRKTPERKSPARKVKQASEDVEPSEEVSLEKELSPRRTRSTADRKSPARKLERSSLHTANVEDEKVSEETVWRIGNASTVEKFKDGDTVMENLPEPLPETELEVPERRRSTRLNTPDRSLVEPAGMKATPTRSGRRRTPPRQQKHASEEDKKSDPPVKTKSKAQDVSAVIEVTGDVSATTKLHQVNEEKSDTREDVEESYNLRKSRRQSKTPDRFGESHKTSTRKSKRDSKTPDTIVKKAGPEEDCSAAASKVLVTVEEEGGELSPILSRRSTRRAKSPDRLNTDQLEPVTPHTSPTRSKPLQTAKQSTTLSEKSELSAATGEKAAEEVPVRTFLFSPPVSHKHRGQDSECTHPSETEPDSPTSQHHHHFVFSRPSVATPPTLDEEKEKPKPKRGRKKHKLYTEYEYNLFTPSPEGSRKTSRSTRETREKSGTRKTAAAAVLKRYKQIPTQKRRLVPSRKKSDWNK